MPTRQCDRCGDWVDKTLLFCPNCRVPVALDDDGLRRSDIWIAILVTATIMIALFLAMTFASH